jgi:hypothetical protein
MSVPSGQPSGQPSISPSFRPLIHLLAQPAVFRAHSRRFIERQDHLRSIEAIGAAFVFSPTIHQDFNCKIQYLGSSFFYLLFKKSW